jgi:hypothetical protein
MGDPIEPAPASTSLPTIFVLNRDLFFGVRIGNLLKSADYDPRFAKTTAELVDLLRTAISQPVLIIVDIGAGPDWDQISSLTTVDTARIPILAFGPHKDVDALRAAKAAGVARVVANSEFHRNALALIQRYAATPI